MMKKHCLIFQNENIYMHLHCYIENDEMYFKLIEIYTLFRYSINIKILMEYFEMNYRSFNRFININKKINIYIKIKWNHIKTKKHVKNSNAQ